MNLRSRILRGLYVAYGWAPAPIRRAVRPLARFARSAVKSDSVVVDGIRMHLDLSDPGAFVYTVLVEDYERSERQAFRAAIRRHPGCTVVDLGAQFGIYSVTALATREAGYVLVVEASPRAGPVLKRTLDAVPSGRYLFFPGAVGDRAGRTTFWLDQQSSSDNRGFQDGPPRPGTTAIDVDVQSVDGLLAKAGIGAAGDFVIKMDVQGAELLALRGMREVIEAAKSLWVFFECGREYLESAGATLEEFAAAIDSMRITHAWRVEKGERGLLPMGVAELLREVRAGQLGQCEDYVVARAPGLLSDPFATPVR